MVRTTRSRVVLAFGLAAACSMVAVILDASASGDRKAATGRLIDIPLFTATAEEGAVVLVAGAEVGASRRTIGDYEITVPVTGAFVRDRGPFAVPVGTDQLLVTMGERLGGFDSPFFVAAIFVPDDARLSPYVISAPRWVNFLSVEEFRVPDQEDSPGLNYAGPGLRVFARSDELGTIPAPPGRGRGRRR